MFSVSVTPRQFIAGLGVLLLLAGAIAILFAPVNTSYETLMFGESRLECGTTIQPNDRFSGVPKEVCDDAIGTRRAWGWPLLAGGGVMMLAAALLVVFPARQSASEHETES